MSDDEGVSWEQILSNDAPGHWAPRAYFQAVVKGNAMYVLGGQDFGIMSNFFNDVWSSTDGVTWTELTSDAGWEGRAGLRAVTFKDEIYIFGGSQFDDAAIVPGEAPPRIYYNDVWKSADGMTWQEMTDDIKYDFEGIAVGNVIYTFGGDRETFDFEDPTNYLRVDNDVWRYALPTP